MLHEEEIALRRALHASLNASKTVDNEENKDSSDDSSLASFKKHRKISNLGAADSDEAAQKNKRECDESVGNNDKKRQKKLLVKIKPKHGKRKGLGNAASKDIVKKRILKSKTFMKKKILAAKENNGRVIKKRRRKKNVDQVIDNGNTKSNERYAYGDSRRSSSLLSIDLIHLFILFSVPKVHVQRKFPQTSPASPRRSEIE